MDEIKQNQNIINDELLKAHRTSKNSPINKLSTEAMPYNRKKINNSKNINEINYTNYKNKNNNNLIHKKFIYSDNVYNNFENKIVDNNQYNYDNKINNKVINININYNDKYNYFDNYHSNNIKTKKEFFDFDILNYNIEENKSKFNSTKNNDIIEINLNDISKNKIKNALTSKHTIHTISPMSKKKSFYSSNKDNDIKKNELIIRNKTNKINSKKKLIIIKSHNIKNKRNKKEPIKSNIFSKPEEESTDNISNSIKDKNIILFLNKNNNFEIRMKGFRKLNVFIKDETNKDIIINNIKEFFLFIYFQLNSFKENNINLLIEGLSCILHMFESFINKNKNYYKPDIEKYYIEIIISGFSDKINNAKIKNLFMKLLYIFIYLYSIKDVFDILLNNISINTNNIVILKDYIIFIINVLKNSKNKDKLKKINLKNLINFIIKVSHINNIKSNPQLKLLLNDVILILYKIYGKIIKEYLKEKNELIFNKLEQQLIKTEIDKEKEKEKDNIKNKIGLSKSFMTKNKTNLNNKIKKLNINYNIRKDISKKITPKIIEQISSNDYKSIKNAIDYINELIIKNKNITINGLKNIFCIIKNKINNEEPNITCLFLQLLSNLISALGLQIKIYSNILIYPLISNLCNMSQEIREKSYNCLEKWIKIQGLNDIIIYTPELLMNKKSNITMKLELLKLLLNNYNLIEIDSNENMILNLFKSLLNCLLNKSMILRNYTEKLIKKLYNNIQKEIYMGEINNMNIGIKEKEYLYNKIDLIFSNFDFVNKKINKIIIKSINKVHKQNSFNNRQISLLNEISSDNDKSNCSNIFQLKQKISEGRNKSTCSNNSLNTFNLKSHTLSLNHSTDQLNKNKKKNSLIINGKTMGPVLKYITNKNINLMNYSNNNLIPNRFDTNSSFPIRKRTNTDKFNKLIFSSIIIPSKIRKKYNFDDKSKLLPDEVKREIKKLKTMQNMNNKKNNYKFNCSEREKKISNFLNINQSQNNSSKHRKNYYSQIIDNGIIQNKKQLFKENYELYIFSSNYNNNNMNKAKQLRYEEDKKVNFDIQEIQNLKKLKNIVNNSHNIFSFNFIQNIFNDDIEYIIYYLTKLNKLLDKSILNNDNNVFSKIIDNLDIILKILSYHILKYNEDALTKIFFIFVYSVIKLSKLINCIFNDTEITILLNILCNKLINDKNIISETAYNLIFFLINKCERKNFIINLAILLKYQNSKIIKETIKIIQNLSEKCKYKKEIMIEIVVDILNIYFKNDDIKNIILQLLINIFNSIGDNKFWEKCKFLSKEKKNILSKNIFEYKKVNPEYNIKNDNDIINFRNISLSPNKKQDEYNNKIYNNYKTEINKNSMKIKKSQYINQNKNLTEDNKKQIKVIKRNKTLSKMTFFKKPNELLSKHSSNNISLDLNYLIIEENNKDKSKTKESIIQNELLKSLNILKLENVKDE